MKVTKAQVQANRSRILEAAAQLFRERGYDGVGVADLMAAAGLTHGGFYKHFESKAHLMAEAAAHGMAQRFANGATAEVSDFLRAYLSREHRDAPGMGCTIAALGADAARKPDEVRAAFATGIEDSLAAFGGAPPADPAESRKAREAMIASLAGAVGALILSRACPDDAPLADEILDVCRRRLLAALPASRSQDA